MAYRITCGAAAPNEEYALAALEKTFGDQWALLTNIPRSVAGREIDACLVGERGMIIVELKNYSGKIVARSIGGWEGVSTDDARSPTEQAELAAQILSGKVMSRDLSLRGKIYITSIVLVTGSHCELTIGSPSLLNRVDLLAGAVSLVERRLSEERERHLNWNIIVAFLRACEIPDELFEKWEWLQVRKRGVTTSRPSPREEERHITTARPVTPPAAPTRPAVLSPSKRDLASRRPVLRSAGWIAAVVFGLWLLVRMGSSYNSVPQQSSSATTDADGRQVSSRQWTSAVAWKAPEGVDDAIRNCRDWPCVYDVLEGNAAPAEALDFLKAEQQLAPTNNLGYPTAFRGSGKVKVVEVWEPGVGQEGSSDFVFVNGRDGIFRPTFDIDQLTASSDEFERVKADYPKAMPWPDVAFEDEAALPDGGQQFQFKQTILDGCHACAVLGTLRTGLNFDAAGRYVGVSVVQVTLDPDAAYGALVDDLSQKTQYYQTVSLTRADGSEVAAPTQTIISETTSPQRRRCQFSVSTNPNMTSGWFTLDERFNLADVQLQESSDSPNALTVVCNISSACISPVYSDARGVQPAVSSVGIVVPPENVAAAISDFQKLQSLCIAG